MEGSVPRPPRYPLIGVPQHVIQRGNNRQPTFFIEDDFRFYRECLKEASTNHHDSDGPELGGPARFLP
jgi:putative transposase